MVWHDWTTQFDPTSRRSNNKRFLFFSSFNNQHNTDSIKQINTKMHIVFRKMNIVQKCWWCQNVVAEATMQDHARNCLALKWVAQRKAGTPEDQITYHPNRHVRRFIDEGWEEIGRREEERWREREAEKRRREEERERRERQREKEERRREERAKTEKQREEEQQRIEEEWRQLRRRRELNYWKDCQEAGFKLKKE